MTVIDIDVKFKSSVVVVGSVQSVKSMMEWSALVVGEEFGPFVYSVGPELVERYRAAVGDEELVSVGGVAVAPPTLLTFPFLKLLDAKYAPKPGTIHAQQDFEFLAPVRVGAVLTVTGTLAAMELRRGRRYFTVEALAVDDAGVEVARSRTVGLYPS